MKLLSLFLGIAAVAGAQGIELVKVSAAPVERVAQLPGELTPFQRVAVTARVTGLVESISVDRGSTVQAGQVIATLSAPEMQAQIAEAEARVETIRAQKVEAEAKVVAAENILSSLKTASATAGAVAANDLVQAQKTVDAARAIVTAFDKSAAAATASVTSLRQLEKYLRIEAPFAGTITNRYVHPGALVGPSTTPLVDLEQTGRLRLVVAVPEQDAVSFRRGARLTFTVPARPGQTYSATIARSANSLDPKTRTMPVEADVTNTGGALAPGMYANVAWPVSRKDASLWVPPTAVVTTTERTFVIRASDGITQWVNVTRGVKQGDLIEVRGPLAVGDAVVKRATDEIREGTKLP